MADIKEIIKKLHDLRQYLEDKEWSDKIVGAYVETVIDTIALLKEQEAVEPTTETIHDNILERDRTYDACGNCGFILYPKPKYCPSCGRLVKWND